MALATVADLAAWFGITLEDNDVRAQALLNAASGLVLNEVRRTWDDGQVPEDVKTVTVQVAARAWVNRGMVQQETVSVWQRTFTSDMAQGLFLTGADLAVLARYRKRSASLFTVATTRDGDEQYGIYYDVGYPSGPPGKPVLYYDTDDFAPGFWEG